MAVRWVRQAVVRPHHCAFLPQLGASHRLGYFDFGTSIQAFDGHAYASAVAVSQMAELMGWGPKADESPLVARIAELEQQLAERDDRLVQAERFRESAQYAMEQFGKQIPARKPGRPKTKVA